MSECVSEKERKKQRKKKETKKKRKKKEKKRGGKRENKQPGIQSNLKADLITMDFLEPLDKFFLVFVWHRRRRVAAICVASRAGYGRRIRVRLRSRAVVATRHRRTSEGISKSKR